MEPMTLPHLHHPSFHRSWLEVDLAAIRENIMRFHDLCGPKVQIMPAVKGDAYGHGAVAVARAALQAGCTRLAIATALEGEELRAAGIEAPLQILGASLPEEVPSAVAHGLTFSLHDVTLAELVSVEAVRQRKTVKVHIKVDTGMGRLGILPEKVVDAAVEISRLPGLELEGAFMHFADAADEAYSKQQLKRFNAALAAFDAAGVHIKIRHAASSVAAVLYADARFDMVRPGAGIYGFHDPEWLHDVLPLVPALSWKSLVIQVKDYPPGSSLGYSRTFVTRRPTRIAVLPVGYADGYPRACSNHASVLVEGVPAPVVGTISMDYTMVDVTDLPEVAIGTEVTLIGESGDNRVTVEELARHAGTIPYIVTCGLGRRPGRVYVDRPDPTNDL